ncbi:MAG: ArsR family transcriptional regulator [Gracilibacter sp. BRH_c7a]|nr:MAG: ArsR family transcriptional regulator [Gracilibacter sp. BRH_c7a]
MIKIIYAVPENHKIVENIIRNKSTKDIEFEVINHLDMQALMACDLENTIIIARGIKYLILSTKFKHARIIKMAITGYDIMRCIKECKSLYNAKNIAIVLSDSEVIDKEFIESTLDVKLFVFAVRDHVHVSDVYNKVKNMDIDAILGGLSVYRMAVRDNFNFVRITVGYETNVIAINEALSVANAIIEERKKNEFLKIILENTNDGILGVDNRGYITAYNEAVFKILGIPPTTVLKGNNISAVSQRLNEVQFLLHDYQEVNVLKNINNKMVVINTKPIMVDNKILGTVLMIQNVDALQKTEIDIRQKLSKKGLVAKYDFTDIIGSSEAIHKTILVAEKYAEVNLNVLIIGETGTGKELFAQSIHKKSKRSNQPFVAINCAALPENLLESELFGYVEGAFSGANKGGKVGLFELAHKGTLFLDEIAELPLGLQAKLLRVLQEQEIRKLGDDKIIPVDVRIIAASNVDLQRKVEDNKFRQDLLYRLDILRLHIPPLRDRKSDIKEIAYFFLSIHADDSGEISMTDEAIIDLIKYDWPGNIRELKNICDRLTVLCTHNLISGQDIRELFANISQNIGVKPEDIMIGEEKTRGKAKKMTRQEMADMLGISRTTLWKRTKDKDK